MSDLAESILRKLAHSNAFVRPGGRDWWIEANALDMELTAEEIAYLAALIEERNAV